MKTFVISLKRSVERRQFMIEQMNRLGLDYEIFDAIDGQLLTENDISHYCDINAVRNPNGYYASNGTLGCALSHYSVLKKIVEEGLESALILEDDALLPLNIKDILSELENVIRNNEVIALFYSSAFSKILKLSLIGGETIKSGKLLFPVNIEVAASAIAYVVHKEAAMNMVRVIMPLKTCSDDWGTHYKNRGFTSFRCLYPSPVKPNNFKSSIDYINPKSKIGKLAYMVDKYKIPVFYQLLAYRRKLIMKKQMNYELVNEVSPIYEKLIAGENTGNIL